MPFKYDKLWSLIKSKGITKTELRDKIKASQATIVNLGRNKNVSLDVIARICNELNCLPEDIYEFIPDLQPEAKIKYKCGDLYYADLGQSGIGSEQNGLRPVLIVQNDIYNKYSSVIIAPLSSDIGKVRISTHIEIYSNKKNNLPKDNIIKIEHIRSIDNRRLKGKIGEANTDVIEKVKDIILSLFGISTET